jgi:hypothetical protein
MRNQEEIKTLPRAAVIIEKLIVTQLIKKISAYYAASMFTTIFARTFFLNSHSEGWSPNGVHSARQPLLAYCTCPGDCEDGEFGGIKIGRGNRSTWRKPTPTPLCPPQIPLDQTRVRIRAAVVGSQRLTATRTFMWPTTSARRMQPTQFC